MDGWTHECLFFATVQHLAIFHKSMGWMAVLRIWTALCKAVYSHMGCSGHGRHTTTPCPAYTRRGP